MRALSWRAAMTCEHAKSPPSKCQCRCGGAAHGKGRTTGDDRAAYEALPREDPHHLPDKKEKQERREKARREREKFQARLFKEI